MAHIKAYFPTIRPENNKKDSKIDPSLRRGGSFTKTTARGISAFNFRRYRQSISTNVREFVSDPILAVAVRENV